MIEIIYQETFNKLNDSGYDAPLAQLVMDAVAARYKSNYHNQLAVEYATQTDAFERLKAFLDDEMKEKEQAEKNEKELHCES